MKICIFILFVVTFNIGLCDKKAIKYQKKLLVPKLDSKCQNINCSSVEEPECIKLKDKNQKNRTMFIIMINKCEMEYMKCHEGFEATIMPMKHCIHESLTTVVNNNNSNATHPIKDEHPRSKRHVRAIPNSVKRQGGTGNEIPNLTILSTVNDSADDDEPSQVAVNVAFPGESNAGIMDSSASINERNDTEDYDRLKLNKGLGGHRIDVKGSTPEYKSLESDEHNNIVDPTSGEKLPSNHHGDSENKEEIVYPTSGEKLPSNHHGDSENKEYVVYPTSGEKLPSNHHGDSENKEEIVYPTSGEKLPSNHHGDSENKEYVVYPTSGEKLPSNHHGDSENKEYVVYPTSGEKLPSNHHGDSENKEYVVYPTSGEKLPSNHHGDSENKEEIVSDTKENPDYEMAVDDTSIIEMDSNEPKQTKDISDTLEPDEKEYEAECPQVCPSRDVMVCAKCEHGIYKTFSSVCHMRMFKCKHADDNLELISRYPCVLSAPYLSDEGMVPQGRVVHEDDDDVVLRFIMCRDKNRLGAIGAKLHGGNNIDTRCNFESKSQQSEMPIKTKTKNLADYYID